MKHILSFLMIIFLFSLSITIGQDVTNLIADTANNEVEVIEISQVAIKLGDAKIETINFYEEIIPDEEIEKIRAENDSVVFIIDSLLAIDKAIDLESKSIRYLNNRLVFWENGKGVLDEEKSLLADVIQNLEESKYDLEHEKLVWGNTNSALGKGESEAKISGNIDELTFMMDTIILQVQNKSDRLLALLNQNTRRSVVVDGYIKKVDQVILEQESNIFVPTQSNLFSSKLTDKNSWEVKKPLKLFYQMEIRGLARYLEQKVLNIVFQLILILFLLIAFRLIKKWIVKTKVNENSFYENILVKVLSRSISAAFLLGLFATALIFPNRPELFKDIMRLLATIPLILIVTTFLDKKFFKYVYLFGAVIYLQMAYFIFSPGLLIYSALVIIVALIEIVAMGNLVIYFNRNPLARKFMNKIVILALILNIGFAFAGLIGILFGAIMLAEVSLNVPIANVFAGVLLITIALILNGLIEIGFRSPYFQKMNIFRLHSNYLKTKVIKIINFTAISFWFFTMLKVLNIDNLIVNGVISFFTGELKIGTITFTLGSVVLFFFVIWLSIVISKMIRIMLEEDILKRLKLAKGLPHTIAMMVRYSLVVAGFFLAVSAVGMPLDNLTVLFGAFGVGIGFGLQNIFNNLVSGLILLFERPIQIGDTIEVGTLLGIVKSIGIRASNVRTFDGAEVIVPNGNLISNEVVNWTLSDQRRRIEVVAGVAYGSDPHKVKELFLKILADHPDIIDDPAPGVLFKELGSSSLDFRLLFWTSNFDEWLRIQSDIVYGVHDILKKEGIEIPFPQQDLHLRSVDPGVEIVYKGK